MTHHRAIRAFRWNPVGIIPWHEFEELRIRFSFLAFAVLPAFQDCRSSASPVPNTPVSYKCPSIRCSPVAVKRHKEIRNCCWYAVVVFSATRRLLSMIFFRLPYLVGINWFDEVITDLWADGFIHQVFCFILGDQYYGQRLVYFWSWQVFPACDARHAFINQHHIHQVFLHSLLHQTRW